MFDSTPHMPMVLSFAGEGITSIAVKWSLWSQGVKAIARSGERSPEAISPMTGAVAHQELLASSVHALCGRPGMFDRAVAIAIPSRLCFFARVEVRENHGALERSDILTRLQPHLPCSLERLAIDFHQYAREEDSVTGIVACAAKRDALDPYIAAAATLGRRIVSVVPAILAVAHYVEALDAFRQKSCFAVMSIEEGSVEILVCDRGIPVAHERIIIEIPGGRSGRPGFEELIAESGQVSTAQISQLLCSLQDRVGSGIQIAEVVSAGALSMTDAWLDRLQVSSGIPCTRSGRSCTRDPGKPGYSLLRSLLGTLDCTAMQQVKRGHYDDLLGLIVSLRSRMQHC